MAFQLSPGVAVSEVDLTTIIPAVSTSAGAIVGQFAWGPTNKRILVDSEITLVNRFGQPDGNNYVSFFSAANFLAYGNNLQVVRVANTAQLNATGSGTGVAVGNEDLYEIDFPVGSQSGAYGKWYARYPGALGNSLAVSVCANTAQFASWTYTVPQTGVTLNLASYFDSAPGTSSYGSSLNGSADELHIAVIDVFGLFSSGRATVIETFPHASKASDGTNDDGSPNYYVTRIFNNSKYIYVADLIASDWGVPTSNTTFSSPTNSSVKLSGGSDPVLGGASAADYNKAWGQFTDPTVVDVSLLVSGYASDVGSQSDSFGLQAYIASIASTRKDCISFLSPDRANSVSNNVTSTGIAGYRQTLQVADSYSVMDSGWKYQFDKYNNTYRYIPLNGDIAGLCVYTDSVRDPWWSPAGLNRGQIKNVVKLSWNPSQTDRDVLYSNGVNPVVSFPGDGTVLFGDKTLQSKPSAFDRINVRRLFITLEKAIARAAKYSLFEFNDEFTRAQFVALVEPFLRDVQGRRGIYDYRVVCDTTNNTPQVIDSNRFVGDIYIKPARSINFIQLNFVAVRTGVDFTEVVGKF